MSGEQFESSLESGMIFFRLRQSKLRRAATTRCGDVSPGRLGEPIAQTPNPSRDASRAAANISPILFSLTPLSIPSEISACNFKIFCARS
jgi:hypothetical protein